MSALEALVKSLQAPVSTVEGAQNDVAQAESSAREAVHAAAAFGREDDVMQVDALRSDIEQQGGALGLTRQPSGSPSSTVPTIADGDASAAPQIGRHRKVSYSRWRASGRHRMHSHWTPPSREAVAVGLSSLSTVAAGTTHLLPNTAQVAVNVTLAGGGTASALAAYRAKKKQERGQQDANRPGR